jgi:hypothetical protein
VTEGYAPAVELEAGIRVDSMHVPQRQPKLGLEMVHAAVIGAELVLESGPRDEGGFPRVNAPQALRQPCVDIESKGALFQRPEGLLALPAGIGIWLG